MRRGYPQYCGVWRTVQATTVQYTGVQSTGYQCREESRQGHTRAVTYTHREPVKTKHNLWAVPDPRWELIVRHSLTHTVSLSDIYTFHTMILSHYSNLAL